MPRSIPGRNRFDFTHSNPIEFIKLLINLVNGAADSSHVQLLEIDPDESTGYDRCQNEIGLILFVCILFTSLIN